MMTQPVPSLIGLLDGKVALITGASRGIGAAAAQTFAQADAAVVLAARDEAALASLAAEIEQAGGRVSALPTDGPTRPRSSASSSTRCGPMAASTQPSTTPATITRSRRWRISPPTTSTAS